MWLHRRPSGIPATMTIPDDSHERALISQGCKLIAGVDEVGRGPLAGPVVAAAVLFDPATLPEGLRDSKALSKKKLAALSELITANCRYAIGEATVEEIDEINILRASHVAMCRAIAALPAQPEHVLVDGNMIPKDLTIPASAIIKGDAKSVSISAAAIVAKIWRDRVMCDLAQHYPQYGWDSNAGYPSKSHKEALRDFGVTPHHRRSFKPIHNILYQE